LSIFRTPSTFRSTKFHLAVTAPAVAVAALAGTLGVISAGAAAQPAAAARPAAIARPAAAGQRSQPVPASARLLLARSTAQPAELDAVLAVSAAPHEAVVAGSRLSGKGKGVKLTPRQIALGLLGKFHWSRRQFPYLDKLWSRESSWNVRAENLYSGAYGIPQAVPGAKMASAGPHWETSARTQIMWGLEYIKARYGSPAGAWEHELATGWY
jgi:hypothetical protein